MMLARNLFILVSTALAANTSATLRCSRKLCVYQPVSTALAANTSATPTRLIMDVRIIMVSTALAANTSATRGNDCFISHALMFQQP